MSAVIPALVSYLAQAPDPLGTLGSVGVVGAIAVLALLASRALYQAQIATLKDMVAAEKDTVTAERARADRYETELRTLHETIRDKVLTSLAEATTTQREAIQAMREQGTLR